MPGCPTVSAPQNQDAFISERVQIVVATVAFGMGIDRSNVRFVVHAGAPRSVEHYQQEAGRAGRDGLEAECTLFYSTADFVRWKTMLESNGELTEQSRALLRQMERYATSTGCRHRHVAEYFGDRYSEATCEACDVCLGELEQAHAPITVARQVLSCVARVGQRFGATHVANVLRGHSSDQVVARGHDKLSTYGLLKGTPAAEVRGYIEQLIGLGLLASTDDAYPVLFLTQGGIDVLKDESKGAGLTLVRPKTPDRKAGRPSARVEAEAWRDVDRGLFEQLRDVRLQVARARGVPPYVVFHDATLREMARLKPASAHDLLAVRGVGARKAEDLGEVFLEAIRRFESQARAIASSTISSTSWE